VTEAYQDIATGVLRAKFQAEELKLKEKGDGKEAVSVLRVLIDCIADRAELATTKRRETEAEQAERETQSQQGGGDELAEGEDDPYQAADASVWDDVELEAAETMLRLTAGNCFLSDLVSAPV
jgi:type II secretory pathway component PulK